MGRGWYQTRVNCGVGGGAAAGISVPGEKLIIIKDTHSMSYKESCGIALSFFLSRQGSAIPAEVIMMIQALEGQNSSWLVHLLFRFKKRSGAFLQQNTKTYYNCNNTTELSINM